MDPLGGGPDFDLVAASIRADASDLRTFLNVIASKLDGALPGHVTIQREGGLFAREKPVRLVKVALGARRYELEWAHGEVAARVATGAQTPLDAVSLDRCIDMLSHDLVDQARTSNQARSAMDSLLAGQLPADVIARPAAAEGQIVYRWPNGRTSRTSQLVISPDEQVVLVKDGAATGPVLPGRHTMDEVSPVAADGAGDPTPADIEASINFVLTREMPNLRFGGMIDKVIDPQTGLAVGLRVFGDYSLRVLDPRQVVLGLGGGQLGITNATFTDLMRDLLLKVLREDVVAHISQRGWPILGLAAHGAEIESATLKGVQTLASGYGLEITRMGNFTISMKDEDEALLTAHRLKLAEAAAGSGAQACAACGTANPAAARFCLSCGSPLALTCEGCGTANPSGARFCQACGRPLVAAAQDAENG